MYLTYIKSLLESKFFYNCFIKIDVKYLGLKTQLRHDLLSKLHKFKLKCSSFHFFKVFPKLLIFSQQNSVENKKSE